MEELRADRVEAIEAMIGALEDPASRKLVELGMTLATTQWAQGLPTTGNHDIATEGQQFDRTPTFEAVPGVGGSHFAEDGGFGSVADGFSGAGTPGAHKQAERLDMVKEQLEAQLTSFTTANARVH